MIEELHKVTTLKGLSGKCYEFHIWFFSDFDDVKRTFTGKGLYLFTRRFSEGVVVRHYYLYLGETGDYYTRYDNHHKEKSIMSHMANCIAFYPMLNSSESERIEAETDLLRAYDFPCNKSGN